MISYSRNADIGIIEFDDHDSKVNLLSRTNLDLLAHIIDSIIEGSDEIKALFFISGKKDTFIAGADIKELAVIRSKEDALEICKKGQDLFDRIEDLKMPTLAVVNGACVGGGLELALSCKCILATRNRYVRFGLPEVTLGIIPGFGGPHRLAQRIGIRKAEQLISSGRLIDLKEARRLNIVDGIIPESEALPYQRLIRICRKRNSGKARDGKRHELNKKERELLAERIVQEPARNSISSYLLVSKYKNYTWLKYAPSTCSRIERCAVIGAGTMGKGITYLVSSKTEIPVDLIEKDSLVLKKARIHIRNIYKDAVKRGILYNTEARSRFRNILFGSGGSKDVDLVIESITEDALAKKRLFVDTERHLARGSIIGTNTSCLSIEELARPLRHADRFIGVHFFNPAYKMRLVEVVPTRFTNEEVLERVIMFLQRLGRIPIVVKDSPGFLVNRMMLPYLNEAVFMLEEGFSVGDIEDAVIGFGMPVGPIGLLETIGLDIAYKAGKILEDSFGSRMRVPEALKDCTKETLQSKKKRTRATSLDIVGRLLGPMKREAGLCLEEGLVDDQEIIDLALLLGIGFPASKRIWNI